MKNMQRALYLIALFFGLHASVAGAIGLCLLALGDKASGNWLHSLLLNLDYILEYPLSLYFEHPESIAPRFFSDSIPLAIANSFCFGILFYSLLYLVSKVGGTSNPLNQLMQSEKVSRSTAAEGLRSGLPYLSLAENHIRSTGQHRTLIVSFVFVVHLMMASYGEVAQVGIRLGSVSKKPTETKGPIGEVVKFGRRDGLGSRTAFVTPNSFLAFHRFPLVPFVISHEKWEESDPRSLQAINSLLFAFCVFAFLTLLARWVGEEKENR